MFETGVVGANECQSQRQVRGHNRNILSIFLDMKVCCMFSLESPHRSNEYTQYTILNIKKKITLNYSKSASKGFFSKGVLVKQGKRVIRVRATEILLYSVALPLKTNILYYTEHTLCKYWFYDPVM